MKRVDERAERSVKYIIELPKIIRRCKAIYMACDLCGPERLMKMGGKLFRTGLFGFKKPDVNKYIENISNDFSVEIEKKDKEIECLKEKLSQLEREVDGLLKEKEQYEKTKDSISGAIIKAEEKAALIIEDAKRAALEEEKRLKEEIAGQMEELRRLKYEVVAFRRQIISSMKRFSSDLTDYAPEENEPLK